MKHESFEDYVYKKKYNEKKNKEEEKEKIYSDCNSKYYKLTVENDNDVVIAKKLIEILMSIHPYKDSKLIIDGINKLINQYYDKKAKEDARKREEERIKKIEKIYLNATTFLKIDIDKHNKNQFAFAIEEIKNIDYKDSREVYFKLMKKYDDYLDEKSKRQAIIRKKIFKISLIVSVSISFLLLIITLLTLWIIPNYQYNKAMDLISEGKYEEAREILDDISYSDSKKQVAMIDANDAFETGDYEKGIDFIYNIGGTINVSYDGDGGQSYKEKEVIKLNRYIDNNSKKDKYDFTKWELSDFEIDFKTYEAKVSLKAIYTAHNYLISYDLDGGNNNLFNSNSYNVEMSNITLYEPNKEGYTFTGWECDGEQISEIDISKASDINLKATWTYYTLTTTINDNNAGIVTQYNNTKVTAGKQVTISATNMPGYSFGGWYNGEIELTKLPNYTFNMPSKNIIYEAKFIPNKFNITIDNNLDDISITGINSGEKYDCGSTITLVANNVPSGYVIGWSRSDNVSSVGNEYTFTVPPNDLKISISKVCFRDGNNIYFGNYPQEKVVSEDLIQNLNELAGELPSLNNLNSWIDYNYYIKTDVESYMYYKDLDIDGDGTYDYRGVYFTQYRSCNITSEEINNSSTQLGNGYKVNNTYWFEYSPIKWQIIKKDSGKLLLIANLIIDAQEYYSESNYGKFEHNGGNGYNNNYELSNIRKWLNNSFYDLAFDVAQKEAIVITNVNNYVEDVSYDYGRYYVDVKCENTDDKIFVLSSDEFQEHKNKLKTDATDYALCQGLIDSDNWWLRTPSIINTARYVYSYDSCTNGAVTYLYGIRPVCWICYD
ncbi:MAG: DUF6273 domain-containing protein [Acholeplasmatales bacterium]|nr:DUF6273 domain-containing protein [Acholeplasmatales bacterium]